MLDETRKKELIVELAIHRLCELTNEFDIDSQFYILKSWVIGITPFENEVIDILKLLKELGIH